MNHTFPGSGLPPPMIIFFHYTLIAAESGNLASELPDFESIKARANPVLSLLPLPRTEPEKDSHPR